MLTDIYTWVKCKDNNYPGYNRTVIVYSKKYGKVLAKYSIDGNWYLVNFVKSFDELKEHLSTQLTDVTHWQPLPNTPTE